MLIKYKNSVINLDNVITFFKDVDRLVFISCEKERYLSFDNEKSMDKAFEEIWRDYNWHRTVCNLDNL